MKKALFLLLASIMMVACTPTTPTTNAGTDSTAVDSTAMVVQDTTPTVDSAAIQPDPVVDGGKATDPVANTDNGNANTGRQANPGIDLNAKRFKVSGNVLIQGSYCGGAAPSPEIEAEARKPKPAVNQAFVVRKGSINAPGTAMVTRVRTDAKGNFSLELTPGTYCMVIDEKENRRTAEFLSTAYYVIDKKCDDKWLTACDLSFTIADKPISGLRLTLNRKCMLNNTFSPCVSWDGPLPPMSAPRGGGH